MLENAPGRALGRAEALGLREAMPDQRLASRELKVFDGVEVALHQWLPGEATFPPFDGHLTNLHLSGPIRSTTRLDDAPWEGWPVSGDLEVFPAGKRVERAVDGPSEDINIMIDEALIERVAAESGVDPDRVEVLDRFNVRDPQMERLLLSLLPELESGGLGGEVYVESLANALAVHLLRHHSSLGRKESRALESEPRGGLSKRQFRLVADYIDSSLAGKLSVEAMAQEVNLSPRHFSRAFKEATGLSPHQYVIRRRVERAKDLLIRGVPVGEAARWVGFADQSHLARHFRRLTGISPGRFVR